MISDTRKNVSLIIEPIYMPSFPICAYDKKRAFLFSGKEVRPMSFQVLILDKAYRQIQNEVNRHPGEETGGIMIGFRTNEAIVVTDVTGPGPSAVHHPNSIHFDEKYCERKARQLQSRGKNLCYIGDWHSHPFTKLKPSKVDKRSFGMKATTHYRTSFPLMIIAGPGPLIPLQGFVLAGKIIAVQPTLIDPTTHQELKSKAIPY